MAGQLGQFQMQGFSHWKGLTKHNHLYATALGQGAQKASNIIVQLLAAQRGNSLETFLSRFPTREFDNAAEYTWDVMGSAYRNIPLVEARTLTGEVITNDGSMIGVGGEPFYLVFAEDWFALGEVLHGNYGNKYPQRVLEQPRTEGTNTVYKVSLMGNAHDGIPAERLLAGERYSPEYAPVPKELSRKVGDLRFSTPISMRNEWTVIRLQYKVPGSMIDEKVAVGIPMIDVKTGKKTVVNRWMHYVDWTFEKQFQDYRNNALAWGVSNRNSNGEYRDVDNQSGEVIKMGNGLFAQMEVANTIYYNTFSLKLIEDAISELCAGKIDFANRTVILRTGEKGAILFNKAVRDTVSGWTNFTLNGDNLGVVRKTTSPLNRNALAAGYQFTEYSAPNGVTLKLEVDPFYDNAVEHKIQHPLGGPAMSYRFDIMDIGTMDQPNIFMCKIKGGYGEARSIQPGLRDPFTGNANVQFMSHDEDSSILHKMTTFGVCVLDPTRTMSIIPAIMQ